MILRSVGEIFAFLPSVIAPAHASPWHVKSKKQRGRRRGRVITRLSDDVLETQTGGLLDLHRRLFARQQLQQGALVAHFCLQLLTQTNALRTALNI